jgi:hypothetical protein
MAATLSLLRERPCEKAGDLFGCGQMVDDEMSPLG